MLLQEMDEAVKAFSKREEHLLSDSVFVVMMSHGVLGAIMGVHYKEGDPNSDIFHINNIFTHLNTENCKALINKPKVILIQACRGGDPFIEKKYCFSKMYVNLLY